MNSELKLLKVKNFGVKIVRIKTVRVNGVGALGSPYNPNISYFFQAKISLFVIHQMMKFIYNCKKI